MCTGISKSTLIPAHLTQQITLKARCIAALLLALLLGACADTPKVGVPIRPVDMPAWTRDGRHPEFPLETHISAYASAESATEARRKADALLEALIVRYALSLGEKQLEGTRFKVMVTGPADWIKLAELEAAVHRDDAGDGFETVAVSGVSMEELKFRAAPLLVPARQALAANSEPPELDDVNKRVAAWGERFVLAARVLALSLLCGSLDRDAHVKAESAATRLYDLASQMEVTQGGVNEVAKLMGGTARELNLSASFRGRMPAGFKLAWSVEAPSVGVLSGFTEFNLTGQAYCRVLSISSTGHELATVLCTPDLDAMAGRRLGILPLAWRWLIAVPARSNVLLSMDVKERFGANATKPVFSEAFVEWARLNEVPLQDDVAANQRAKYLYHVRIEGLIDITVAKQAGFLIARTSGQVVLRDLDNDAVLFRFSPSIVLEADEDADPGELALQAQREAAGDTLLEFGARILGLFPTLKQKP
ncbi:hypothetical protein PLCT1_02005 [Planctomycetaceae bacterium]|nr:hypothetical protein PLCT1_02005 [Planctomycetaceae bacterium]